jgi:hypothetical protein
LEGKDIYDRDNHCSWEKNWVAETVMREANYPNFRISSIKKKITLKNSGLMLLKLEGK